MNRRVLVCALVLTGAWLEVARTAFADSAPETHYTLSPSSAMEIGCVGACACPVRLDSLVGQFTLVRTAVAPLFTTYDVRDLHWWAFGGGEIVDLVGTGTYRIGGEVAIQQQLSLDLSIDGGTPLHFDSGLQAGGGSFPALHVNVSRHGEGACFDTVLAVDATPVTADVGTLLMSPLRVRPNPSSAGTEFQFVLRKPGMLEARVYDASGRAVRTLVARSPHTVGVQTLRWDGVRDDGRAAPPGVYLVRISFDGVDRSVRFTRLR